MNIGIYGTGLAAKNFCGFLKKSGYNISGFITSGSERAKQFSEETGEACFLGLEDLLAAVPETNVMLVANANERHKAATIASLEKGLHVYCEKPMAPTLAESREMLEAESRSRGSLQIGFEYIHSTLPRRLRELQTEGFFGEMLSVSCLDSRGHWWSDDPDAPFEQVVKLRREKGGGIIYHCGIHQLDMLRAFLGEFEEVHTYRPTRNALPYYPDDVPDHVQVMLRGTSGALGSLEIFHNRAPSFYRRVPGMACDWSTMPGHEFRMSLVGTEGSCLADFYSGKLHLFGFDHQIKDTDLVRTEDYAPLPQNELHHDMNGMLNRYLKNLKAGQGALTPAADAYKTMVLATAVEKSISENRAVVISSVSD